MGMSIPILLISMLLAIVLAFGIGFLANMLFRTTWFMVAIYPIILVMIIDKVSTIEYFTKTKEAFSSLVKNIELLGSADIIILSSGLFGAILSGVVIKSLRKNGYQMF